MKDGQETIFYISGEDPEAALASPQLEGFKAKGVEVLLMTDPVDEFWLGHVGEFDGKPFLNFVCPEDLGIARETVSNIVEGRNIKDVAVRLNTKDGEYVKIYFSALTKGKNWFWFAKKVLIDE